MTATANLIIVAQRDVPQDVDELHQQWLNHMKMIPITQLVHADKHVEDTWSVYVQHFIFHRPSEPCTQRFYIGQSTSPRARASSHSSELKLCKLTSFTGKSSIYSKAVMGGVTSITAIHNVLRSGITTVELARSIEREYNSRFMSDYTEEEVLTRP